MKKWKMIFIVLIVAISCFLPAYYSPPTDISAAKTSIEIVDKNLENRLRTLLDKKPEDKLYADDFVKNSNYASKYDSEKDSYIANRTVLDLSNGNITDIRELIQFQWPQTLNAINLSYNNITYEQFATIYNFPSITKNTEIEIIPDKKIISVNDFAPLIKCINVSNNNIDLTSTFNDSNIDITNEIFIYGLQNYNNNLNKALITKDDITNTSYYIRSNDYNTLSITMYYYSDAGIETRPSDPYPLTYNEVVNISNLAIGKYEILISALDNGYLDGCNFNNINFILFTAKILPNKGSNSEYFEVERLGNFTLPLSLILVDGFGSLSYSAINKIGGTTSELGIQDCQIIVESDGYTPSAILRPYKVIDTTKPVITLIGGNNLLWNLNEPWHDPGCTITDNGAPVKAVITPPESVDYTLIGEYNLTYTYTDVAGNTTSIVRTVHVQAGVLSSITLYTTNEKIEVGKDVVLIAQPYNIDNSKYYDFEYTWIINDEIYKILEGDQTHKSSLTYTPQDKTPINIKVKVTAKQTVDGKSIPVPVFSNEMKLEPVGEFSTTTLTIIIFGGAVAILIVVIISVTIYKAKHSKLITKSNPQKQEKLADKKNKKPKKEKNNKKDKDDNDNDTKNITIIRDYRG